LVEVAGKKLRLLYSIEFWGDTEAWYANPLQERWLLEPHTHPIVERDGRRPTWTPGTILGRSAGGFGAKLRLLRVTGFSVHTEHWDCQDLTTAQAVIKDYWLGPENWNVIPYDRLKSLRSPNETTGCSPEQVEMPTKPSPKPPSDLLEQIRRLRSDFDRAVDKILKEAK
jgi:hypothetical protein